MLTLIILLTFIAAAFWKDLIKLTIAGVLVLLIFGVVHVVQVFDESGQPATPGTSVNAER